MEIKQATSSNRSFHYQPDGRGIYVMFPICFYPQDRTQDRFVDYGIDLYLLGDTGERKLGKGYSMDYCYLKYYFVDIEQDAWTSAVMTLKVEITMKRVPSDFIVILVSWFRRICRKPLNTVFFQNDAVRRYTWT